MRQAAHDGGLAFGTGFPILIGALGPKMLALAASEADGAVLNWLTPEHARTTVELMNEEARSGRKPTSVLYVRMSPPDASRADALSYDSLDNYHRHFVAQGLTSPEAIIAGACLPTGDAGAAAARIAAYADAGIDVLCVYPHGFEEAERERMLAAVADAG
jgi:alkanesulfonate monooxygenase SsuD/methylene tetrahydromethanopterin reductase-like flavin-dependent oxidoreductase (luciferase family)